MLLQYDYLLFVIISVRFVHLLPYSKSSTIYVSNKSGIELVDKFCLLGGCCNRDTG